MVHFIETYKTNRNSVDRKNGFVTTVTNPGILLANALLLRYCLIGLLRRLRRPPLFLNTKMMAILANPVASLAILRNNVGRRTRS